MNHGFDGDNPHRDQCREHILKLMKKPFEHLYIHVPFCASKCAYCAFYSAVGSNDEQIDNYLDKLEQDLAQQADQCAELKSVFMGGGTPTLPSAAQLQRLFKMIHSHFTIHHDGEISLECNPETLDDAKAQVIAKYATRISIGVQSFNDKFRKTLGRGGDVASVYKAVDLLKVHGFTNIGVDLIYAIPGQTLDDWKDDLTKAAELGINHISAYSLSIEEGAELAGGEYSEAEDDISFDMWEASEKTLAQFGLSRYEVSNYSKPGFRCVHNTRIWYGDAYLGCGPSAVSFDGVKRWEQPQNLKSWISNDQPEVDTIDAESRAREIFIMGLRTADGWKLDQFKIQTGFDYTQWLGAIDQFVGHGFFEITDESIKLTVEGMPFWNTISEELI